jgi:transcriptional regulator with XRE-family HTH domain
VPRKVAIGQAEKADFGQAVVFIAEKARLTQKTLAKALHVAPNTVSAWKGGTRRPNPRAMRLLPEVLGCSMAEIEEVAAFFRKWRKRMEPQPETIAEDPLRTYQFNADRVRKIGQIVVSLFSELVSGRIDS